MKTLSTLPTLPEGWVWVYSFAGAQWSPVNPHALAEIRATHVHFNLPAPKVGTPPAGSTVWDPQTLDWARYQPEGA